MHMRRFTRLINAHRKKVDNQRRMVALHYMYYNFCRVHSSLRVTPAQEVGLTDHGWSVSELCNLLPKPVVKKSRIEKMALERALAR